MGYIADLSPYNYKPFCKGPPDDRVLAVGWLDSSVPFTKGSSDPHLLRVLKILAAKPVNLTRGFYTCPYCRRARGNGEIRVAGVNGLTYAAPVLISHYVEKHNYLPPVEFIEAVRALTDLPPRIVIVAALEREVEPLVKHWHSDKTVHNGRQLAFFESDYAVVVCGGIGPDAARQAAEAAITKYLPRVLISAGIAGALTAELRVGDTIFPTTVIDAGDSSRLETAIADAPIATTPLARTVLVSCSEIASAEQKQKFGKAYAGHAVDMEAASVARVAESSGIRFLAIKTISDEMDFELPDLSRFIRNGNLKTVAFALHVAVRPWLWLKVARLARTTRLASENLCAWLRESALTNTIVRGV